MDNRTIFLIDNIPSPFKIYLNLQIYSCLSPTIGFEFNKAFKGHFETVTKISLEK